MYPTRCAFRKIGALEEIKPDAYTPHGRIDYKVTPKGLTHIIHYIIDHPEELQHIIEYMDKFKINKNLLREALRDRFYSEFRLVVYVPMDQKPDLKLKRGDELIHAISEYVKEHPPPPDTDKDTAAKLFLDALRSLEDTKASQPMSTKESLPK